MLFDPDTQHRCSTRLEGYDYAQAGAYFVTLFTHDRGCLFGEVAEDVVHLNRFGEIARAEWLQTAVVRPYVVLDDFVIMPNHMHGIIFIMENADNPVNFMGR